MINFLARLFIKDRENTRDPAVRQAYGVLCGALGICINLLLFTGKFLAGFLSNSIAITADAFNNLSDAGSSIVTLIGFRISGQAPDPDHPFGHGRIEYLAGLLVSGIILIMAFELIKSSFMKILHPEATDFNLLVLIILLVSIAAKLYMFFYNRSVARRINSAAMMATATDSISDTLATTVVLISSLIGHFTGLSIDGFCGILVGFFICWAGINAAKETIDPLLGQPPEEEFVSHIEELVMAYPEVLGIHDLIVHNYGPGRLMISLHAEVSASGDILLLHDTIDNIERKLQTQLHCSAVIHMDPVVTDDPELTRLKDLIQEIVKEIDSQISFHDFRMVKGPTHTNVIFDVVVPFQFKLSDNQIRSVINQKIKEIDPSYFAVVNVDKKYA